MAALTVFAFPDAGEADRALSALHGMEQRHLLKVNDAATVSWPREAHAPRTRQSANLQAVGALDGTFWGMLFGFLFAAPFLGAAAGAAIGALAGRFADFGIDDHLIARVRSLIEPGNSALFLMAEAGSSEEVAAMLCRAGFAPEIVEIPLQDDGAMELQRVFGRD